MRGALWSRGFLAVVALVGLGLRIWVLAGPLGGADADEAVVGLMALDLLRRGEPSTFFWGQAYGGTLDSFLAAAVFAVTGPGRLALKLIHLTLYAVALALVWRIGLRLTTRRGATLGTALFWIASPAFVWWSTKARGHYSVLLVLELLLVLLALRLDGRRVGAEPVGSDVLVEAALLGLAGGLAWWASPQSASVGLPLVLWLAYRFGRSLLLLWPALPGAVVGASPWLRFNLQNDWASLRFPPGLPAKPSLVAQLEGFFLQALPQALGFRVPFSFDWLPPLLGPLVYLAVLAVLASGLARAREPSWLLPLLIIGYPFLFLINPIYYVADPRYLYFLWPLLALAAGAAIDRLAGRQAMAVVTILAVAALSIVGIRSMTAQRRAVFHAPDVAVPADLTALIGALESRDMDRVFAHYALAYPITFESGEAVLGTPIAPVREQGLNQAVRSDPSPGYVLMADSALTQPFRDATSGLGVDPRCERFEQFLLCRPTPKLLPEQVAEVWER